MHLARYYCPPGVALPAHVANRSPMSLVAGAGPDAFLGVGNGGGAIFPGPYQSGEAGWQKTDAGWWLNLEGVLPQSMVRLDVNPRILRWAQVQGVAQDHWWRVPVLVQPQGKVAPGEDPAIMVSALDRLWRGGDRFEDPADLAELQRLLIQVAQSIALSQDPKREAGELARLVVALLGVGHHVTQHEIAIGGWLSETFLLRVLLAACEIPLIDAEA